ncbi:PLDc N-terminal domain-containing protein [uncultured Dokdonia sp.]|uniref:PLDc N-terminal domain-containing protein n=1 Tax=uncultured Dokdonia sp. TaxID=575653 RepID=UPI00262127B3|nr:PLDc N-terminal domain-containing protein [uncultured Dokdonia sp.]
MNLSKSQKIGIGILTFMPILCFIGYIVSFFAMVFGTMSDPSGFESQGPPDTFFAGLGVAMLFMILMFIFGLAALIIHIIHVTKNPKLKKQNNGQLIWILIIILANGIGGIVYYFIEILPEPKESLVPSPEE